MRIEHEEIDLLVFPSGRRDVFALLPDKKAVQLEIFAHDRFTDGSHIKTRYAERGVGHGPRRRPRKAPRRWSEWEARPALVPPGPAARPVRRRPGRFCSPARI